MIYKKTILKILTELNLPADEENAKLIAAYANKGGINVKKITQVLEKVTFNRIIERAKVVVNNNTPSYEDFYNAFISLDMFGCADRDIDDLCRMLYSFFVKQDLSLEQILTVLSSSEMDDFISQYTTAIPIKKFLEKAQSIIDQQNLSDSSINAQVDDSEEPSETYIPNSEEEQDKKEFYIHEDANINIINNLSAISRKLSNLISSADSEFDTTYSQTIIHEIYLPQDKHPQTKLLTKLNALKNDANLLISNKQNAETHASLLYLLSCLPTAMEKIDRLIESANSDAGIANTFISDIIKKQKEAKNKPLDITKYRTAVKNTEESIKILKDLKLDDINLVLASALKRLKPLLEEREKPYNKAKESQGKLKKDKAEYIAEFGRIKEIAQNLKLFKSTLNEIFNSIKTALSDVETKELDEQSINAEIAKLKDKISTLTGALNKSLNKHNKEFKYFDRANDSQTISSQHIANKTQRLEAFQQRLADLTALLGSRNILK